MSLSKRSLFRTRWAFFPLVAMLAGCDRGQVQEYRVAKEQPLAQAQAQAAALPPGHPDTSGAAAPSVQYKRPADWQEAPVGEMRAASLRVPGKDGKQADVSVIPLPGLAGSDLDNVNRWRGQVGLPGVSESDLRLVFGPSTNAIPPRRHARKSSPTPAPRDKCTASRCQSRP